MRVKQVHHIALRAKDLAASVKFYGEKFRFPEVLRYDFDDGSPCCVYVQVADGQFIELFGEGQGDRAPPEEATGFNHVCLVVDDLEEALTDLREAGLQPSKDITTPDGHKLYYFEDPDGHPIELMPSAASKAQAEAAAIVASGGRPTRVRMDVPRPA
jgi:lactoylglutathione lyase